METQTSPQTIRLAPDGPLIPALGVGTWSWGDALFWDYGKTYDMQDVQAAFTSSLAAGINFFDTAEVYGFGKSEQLLGQFAQAVDQPVHIATKYFPLPWRFQAKAVAKALTDSLGRLQLSSIALYQVHWPFDFLMSQKTLMNALAHEVRQGHIQAIGVSNYSVTQMSAAQGYLAKHGIPLATNQVQYSLLHRKVESNGLLATSQKLGITLLAYCPLAQGRLTGKYGLKASDQPQGARRLDPKFSQNGLIKIELVVQTLKQIAAERDRTPAQVALNWLICQGNVVPIPGAKNAAQASQNAGALGWELTLEERERLARVTRPWL